MTKTARTVAFCFFAFALASAVPARPAEAAEGQMSFAVHVTLAPRWLDPAETESAITPFMKGIVLGAQGAGGDAATRIEGVATKNGTYAYGVLPEVEDLFQRQARAEEPALTLIPAFPYAAPYEELRLKK